MLTLERQPVLLRRYRPALLPYPPAEATPSGLQAQRVLIGYHRAIGRLA